MAFNYFVLNRFLFLSWHRRLPRDGAWIEPGFERKSRAHGGDGAGGAGQAKPLPKLKNGLDSGAVGSEQVTKCKRA